MNSLSLLAAYESTWAVLEVTNTTLNVFGTQYFSVISKEDDYPFKLCDLIVQTPKKHNNKV
jgi:hypothetical protein